MAHGDPNHYKTVQLISTAQAIGDSFAAVGVQINNLGYDNVSLFCNITSNNSEAIQIKPTGRFTSDGTEFDVGYKVIKEDKTEVKTAVYEIDDNLDDPSVVFDIDIRGIPFINLYVKGDGNSPVTGFLTEAIGVFTVR